MIVALRESVRVLGSEIEVEPTTLAFAL
jgi:hypothetical protein